MYENCLLIVVDKSDDLVSMLESFGYEKRAGSCAYTRNSITIVPKKKWYWFSTDKKGTRIQNL
jgi:hypothetical protein